MDRASELGCAGATHRNGRPGPNGHPSANKHAGTSIGSPLCGTNSWTRSYSRAAHKALTRTYALGHT